MRLIQTFINSPRKKGSHPKHFHFWFCCLCSCLVLKEQTLQVQHDGRNSIEVVSPMSIKWKKPPVLGFCSSTNSSALLFLNTYWLSLLLLACSPEPLLNIQPTTWHLTLTPSSLWPTHNHAWSGGGEWKYKGYTEEDRLTLLSHFYALSHQYSGSELGTHLR